MAKVNSVIGNGFRVLVAGSLLVILAGCNSTDTGGTLDVAATPAAGTVAPPPPTGTPSVVQGNCPQVVLRDGTAYYRNYAKGAKVMPDGSKDPEKLLYQVSLADTTRQCTQANGQMMVTVMAQGRVVSGPAGAPAAITMPIRVAVVDGDGPPVYTELQPFQVQLNPGETSGQFVYTKAGIALPGTLSDLGKIFIGFDEGPVKPEKKKK